MAEFSWESTTPLSRILVAGHHGASAGTAGLSLTELREFDLVQIMARRGQWDPVAKAARRHFGAPPPAKPQAVRGNATTLIWSGPDQFLALSARQDGRSAMERVAETFSGMASLSDQSNGRALLSLSGPQARQALAKFGSLDLHPAAFPIGASAATSIDHTGVNLWRGADGSDGGPVFFMLVFSTFAQSLLGTMLDAAAEFGVEVGAKNVAAW